jgi:hypothetical protein
MFETRDPGRVATPEPTGREEGSGAARHVMHRSPPHRSGATIHVETSEPFLSRGGVWSHWTRASSGAHLGSEAGPGTAGHVAVHG